MKIAYELMDESNMDVEDLEAERSLQLAAMDAKRRARRFGSFYVIREHDQIKRIPPDQTEPYETRLLASAERLNQRVLALKQSPQPPSGVMLNDQPSQ